MSINSAASFKII